MWIWVVWAAFACNLVLAPLYIYLRVARFDALTRTDTVKKLREKVVVTLQLLSGCKSDPCLCRCHCHHWWATSGSSLKLLHSLPESKHMLFQWYAVHLWLSLTGLCLTGSWMTRCALDPPIQWTFCIQVCHTHWLLQILADIGMLLVERRLT